MTKLNKLAVLAATLFLTTALYAEVGKSVTITDINLATEADLTAMPNMTAALAKSVIAARPFKSIVEVNTLLGKTLTKEQLAQLYGKTFVHINLNSGTREEILLIPGLGANMVKEFFEYRPFTNMAHFSREIGKYVDATETARLAQYVFVPVKLNSATDADILSIPGAGNRMVREFKEYRPWTSSEQFHREIGKYVDQKEVGRLERFVLLQ